MRTENISTLKIHKLTKEQYERELASGNIDETALYLTPDEDVDLSNYATIEQLETKADASHSHDSKYDTLGSASTALSNAKSYTDEIAKTKVNAVSGKGLSTNDYTTDEKNKLAGIETGANKTTVDSSLSSSSTNPVQNKVVNSALSGKVSTSTTVNGKALTGNITLSASDVGADSSGSASTALTNAKAYADEVANGALAIVQANDASVLAQSKSYTDEKVANLLDNSTEAVDSIYELRDAMSDNADAISALQTIASNKANASDLTSHTGSTSNPHNVTKTQVGLGNVPNVATNDQTPTFTVASTLATLTSGEKLSVAFGKISKAITDLASHIGNKTNPHGVTASQVGADASGSASKALADAKTYADGLASGKANTSHTHNYAGSSSAGGSATSAVKLDSSAGSVTQPVYFENGVPKATTYTLGKSVPSNAVFTDTDTHYTSKNVVGASSTATANATATNGNVYLNHLEESSVKSSHKIIGDGSVTVTSDANGVITIKGTDTNTDTNTAHSHSVGVGLVGEGNSGTSGTYNYKAKLRSETALTVDSSAATTTSGRVYPVAVDKSGYLAVNVPWTDTDTTYTSLKNPHSLTIQGNGTILNNGTYDGSAAKTVNITPSAIGAAASSHTHDDRYYTETEIDTKVSTLNTAISGKAASSHTHSISNITNLQTTLDEKLSKSGGVMTGEITIGQGDGYGVQLGTNGRFNATVGSSTDYTVLGMMNGNFTLGSSSIPTVLRGGNYITVGNELRFNGGDATGGSKIVLETNKGQITNSGTSTLFGYTADNVIAVGHSSSSLTMRGKDSRPTYNGYNMALASDIPTIPTIGNGTITIKQNGTSKGSFTLNQTGNTTIELTDTDTDTNTTYSAGTGISLSGTTFSNSGVRSIATGSTNGTISVNTNGSSANVAVKGLGSAAYTNTTAYDPAGAAADAYESAQVYTNAKVSAITYSSIGAAPSSHTHDDRYFTESEINTKLSGYSTTSHTHDYLPLAGGTVTGNLTVNGSTYFNASTYMKNGVFYNAYNKSGTACCIVGIDTADNLLLGTTSYPHPGDTIVRASNGLVHLKNKVGGLVFNAASGTNYNCAFRPNESATVPMLGASSYPWYKVYATTTTISTSDEREKSNIMAIEDYPVTYSRDGSGNVFEKLFKKLTPKTYTLNAEKSNELHIGFVAQDIEQAFEELGLSADELGFIDHDYWTDEETGEEKDKYGLAYTEFIALNTYIIQKQQDEIESLKERIANLEELVNK